MMLRDELAERTFDLIHLRMVLAWLPDKTLALPKLVAALEPGGWLIAEELDFASSVVDPRMDTEAAELFTRAMQAHCRVLAEQHTFDYEYGRRLMGDLAAAGLVEVDAHGRAATWRGGDAGGRIWWLSLAQLREPIVAGGYLTSEELDAALALCDDPDLSVVAPLLMTAWGRRSA